MQQINSQPAALLKRTALPVSSPLETHSFFARDRSRESPPASEMILEVLAALEREKIVYCHWKSNWRIDNWLTGEGDLDLLVERSDVASFTKVLAIHGFKRAIVGGCGDLPGIVNFYGYDEAVKKMIHIHAHYQLPLGHDASKNYRLPIERKVLESRHEYGPIYITEPETELALFVVRMTLKCSPMEELLRSLNGSLKAHLDGLRREHEHLSSKIDEAKFAARVDEMFPEIGVDLMRDCGEAVNAGSTLRRALLRQRLENCLRSYARHGNFAERMMRLKRYATAAASKLGAIKPTRKRFESGGRLIAVIGGDGSGKSTCTNDLAKWLGKRFEAGRFHLGMPPKSALTIGVIALIRLRRKLENLFEFVLRRPVKTFDHFAPKIDFLQRLRWLCTARDRYRLSRRLQRYVARGGIAICDRFPTDRLRRMDAPRIERSLIGRKPNKIERILIKREQLYYRLLGVPDQLIVLRVDPKMAVRRKRNEPARHVRERAFEIWRAEWQESGANVVDANRKRDQVIDEVRSIVWAEL